MNLEDRVLEVYRDLGPDLTAPFGWRYTSVDRFRPGDSLTLLDVRVAPVAVAALLRSRRELGPESRARHARSSLHCLRF